MTSNISMASDDSDVFYGEQSSSELKSTKTQYAQYSQLNRDIRAAHGTGALNIVNSIPRTAKLHKR